MRLGRTLWVLAALALPTLAPTTAARAGGDPHVGVNVLLRGPATEADLDALEAIGTVLDVIDEIHAVTVRARVSDIPAIAALPFVASANPDRERFTAGGGSPI